MARVALEEIDPYPLTVLRFAIAAIAYIAALLLWRKKLLTGRRKLLDISLVGFFTTGLPLLLFFFALIYISSGMFSILFATLPLFTGLLAHFFLSSEKLNKNLLIGLVVSLAGAAYLISTKTNGLIEGFNVKGPLITLVGILMIAGGTVYARARLSKEDPFVVSSLQTFAALILITAIVLALGKFKLDHISLKAWGAVAYNGLVGSFIAFWLSFVLIKKFGATTSALASYVMPVVSSVLGVILLSEIISLSLVLGAIIILFGLFLALRKPAGGGEGRI